MPAGAVCPRSRSCCTWLVPVSGLLVNAFGRSAQGCRWCPFGLLGEAGRDCKALGALRICGGSGIRSRVGDVAGLGLR